MARGEQIRPQLATGELEQFKRLVELQAQLVALARKNEHIEKECEALWRELANAPRPARVPGAGWRRRVLARLRQIGLTDHANRLSALVRSSQFISKPAAK